MENNSEIIWQLVRFNNQCVVGERDKENSAQTTIIPGWL